MKRSILHAIVSLILAINYFAYQVEFFEDEYEANHPKPTNTCSVDRPALNWESFDKENAPEAFVFDAHVQLELLLLLPAQPARDLPPHLQSEPIHDRSPPSLSYILSRPVVTPV
jgi:hypothetical protein